MIGCFRCGECCRTLFNGMIVTGEELFLMERSGRFLPRKASGKANRFILTLENCPFLLENSCDIYDIRPCQCRLYHCGKTESGGTRLAAISEIRALMEANPEYAAYKEAQDAEAVEWGNRFGWNWRKAAEKKAQT